MGKDYDNYNRSALLAEIDTQIQQQHFLFGLPEFEQVPIENAREAVPAGPYSADALEEELTCMFIGQEVPAHRPLPNRGIVKLVKMVLRKLMKFYVEPIARDVSDYNRSNVQAVAQLRNYAVESSKQLAQIDKLQQRVTDLEKRLCELEVSSKEGNRS